MKQEKDCGLTKKCLVSSICQPMVHPRLSEVTIHGVTLQRVLMSVPIMKYYILTMSISDIGPILRTCILPSTSTAGPAAHIIICIMYHVLYPPPLASVSYHSPVVRYPAVWTHYLLSAWPAQQWPVLPLLLASSVSAVLVLGLDVVVDRNSLWHYQGINYWSLHQRMDWTHK